MASLDLRVVPKPRRASFSGAATPPSVDLGRALGSGDDRTGRTIGFNYRRLDALVSTLLGAEQDGEPAENPGKVASSYRPDAVSNSRASLGKVTSIA